MRNRNVVTLALATVLSVTVVARQGTTKPVKTDVVHQNPKFIPVSEDALIAGSPFIIRGTVLNSREKDLVTPTDDKGGVASLPRTTFAVRVSEVFKSDDPTITTGSEIELLMLGGLRDRGDHVYALKVGGLEMPGVGDDVVLMLRKDTGGVFALATESGDSIITVRGNRIESQAKSSGGRAMGQRSLSTLLQLLRQRGRR